jgi:long-chain acyl-CoA synthetase
MEATGVTAGGKPVTFPQYMLLNAKRFAARPAMRIKDYGIWQTWSWAEQRDEIRAFALGLKAMGLKPKATASPLSARTGRGFTGPSAQHNP